MKAEPARQQRLLDLQRVDTRLAQIAHRRANLPEQAALDLVATEKTTVDADLVHARTDSGDIARALTKAEADVQLVRDRAARNRARLEDGSATPKELTGLQHELESLARRQAELEEDQLDVMMRAEALEGMVAALTARAGELEGIVAAATGDRDVARKALDDEADQLAGERADCEADVGAELVALYDKIRVHTGVGAAALVDRHCDGCRLELLGADYQRVVQAAPDEVMRCEECRRILVRSARPES